MVPVTHLQTTEPAYYDSYIAKRLYLVPVAVVRCGSETKLLPKSAVSPCVNSQVREKNAPDRLRSDEDGRLTWREEKVTSAKSSH